MSDITTKAFMERTLLQELADVKVGATHLGVTKISDDECGSGRWSIQHEMILFHHGWGQFVRTYYNVGATEMQDEEPYEYDDEAVEVEVGTLRSKTSFEFVAAKS